MNFEESKRRRDAASDTRCREFMLPNTRNSMGRAVHGVIWDGPKGFLETVYPWLGSWSRFFVSGKALRCCLIGPPRLILLLITFARCLVNQWPLKINRLIKTRRFLLCLRLIQKHWC